MKPELIIYDFDGVMTDNKVIVDQNGIESVICSRDDGWGVRMIRNELRIKQCIVTSEFNTVIEHRAKKLKIPLMLGRTNKIVSLNGLVRQNEIDPKAVLYVGNGLNDLEVMSVVGYPMCPADAHPDVQKISSHVFNAKGGDGVILELYELLLDWD